MFDVDASSVMRAAGLLRALAERDLDRWNETLAADSASGDANPYATFKAMSCLADRLADSVATLADEHPDTVLSKHADALARVTLGEDPEEIS